MAEKPNMDGLADAAQLRKSAYKPGSFYLGNVHPDHGWNAGGELGLINPANGKPDDRHVFIVAGSRSGKGTSLIIPNLLRWEGPVFCIDPKGENASHTALRRARAEDAQGTKTRVSKHLEQRVAILDPFDQVPGPAKTNRIKFTYDPLSEIDPHTDEGREQIENLADTLVVPEQGGEHWVENANTILAGTIEMVLVMETDPAKQTLVECRRQIIEGFEDIEGDDENDTIEGLKAKLARTCDIIPDGLAAAAFDLLDEAGPEERGSFKTTLSRQIKWIGDRRMQRHLQPSEFSLRKAVREGWSIYVVLPPRLMGRMKRWLRAIVGIALNAKMDDSFTNEGPQTLFLLDEFPILGHFQIIEDAAGYMAGYGIKLVPVIQNVGQLRKHYGQNWETFMGNAGAIIAFGLNDRETEEYISGRIGKTLGWEPSYSSNLSGRVTPGFGSNPDPNREGQSMTYSLRERPIRWPSEIRQQGAREHMRAFVLPASGAPFTVLRRAYMEDDGKGWFDSQDHIRAWEKQYARHT